ncbi:acyl transferase [Ligilactobacillus aviarius]|uniref:ACP S-malonyltransferase n=1 Tax=Ligilactobacillus aviarius TaxID=1606 RepID=UPI0007DA43DC|nr:acyltransferase domain-containing protein [Ligilactobacillus aviarius]OAQ04187.1 acyl transferase [Ligilactobacillus aviarius]OAQ04526.1 acyl transferase [Ligilactobacillus aviarius]OAS78485.1 acyl transferase [Ligilactobacillus aviarius]PEG73975.1 acyl transferase [Ligilactobacillus aviarius]
MGEFWIFPGQGYQHAGMLHDVPRSLIDKVQNLTGVELTDTDEAYQDSIQIQLGILTLQIDQVNQLKKAGIKPQIVGGHSLGVFGAAYAAENLRCEDAIRIVYQRAKLMQNAYHTGYGMGVVVGLSRQQVEHLVAQVNSPVDPVFASNQNTAVQIALSGKLTAIQKVIKLAKRRGAQTAKLIKVPVPSHSPLMKNVAKALSKDLREIQIFPSSIRYLTNYSGMVTQSIDDIRYDLGNNLIHPVYWEQMTDVALEFSPNLIVEFSPGHAFSKLIKTKSDIRTFAIDDYGIEDSLFLLKKWKRG